MAVFTRRSEAGPSATPGHVRRSRHCTSEQRSASITPPSGPCQSPPLRTMPITPHPRVGLVPFNGGERESAWLQQRVVGSITPALRRRSTPGCLGKSPRSPGFWTPAPLRRPGPSHGGKGGAYGSTVGVRGVARAEHKAQRSRAGRVRSGCGKGPVLIYKKKTVSYRCRPRAQEAAHCTVGVDRGGT